jgi:hypothetical protein
MLLEFYSLELEEEIEIVAAESHLNSGILLS